jgi:hypothetical protein
MTQPGEARESCDGQRDLDIFAYIFAHFHVPSSSPDTILHPACRVTKDYVSVHKAEKLKAALQNIFRVQIQNPLRRRTAIVTPRHNVFLHLDFPSVCSFANAHSYLLMIITALLLSVAEVAPHSWIDR